MKIWDKRAQERHDDRLRAPQIKRQSELAADQMTNSDRLVAEQQIEFDKQYVENLKIVMSNGGADAVKALKSYALMAAQGRGGAVVVSETEETEEMTSVPEVEAVVEVKIDPRRAEIARNLLVVASGNHDSDLVKRALKELVNYKDVPFVSSYFANIEEQKKLEAWRRRIEALRDEDIDSGPNVHPFPCRGPRSWARRTAREKVYRRT